MVFGVFDIWHEGHDYFLREAKNLGDKLIVVMARDNSVKILKGRLPLNSLADRMENLRQKSFVDLVIPGDETLGDWNVLTQYRPNIIAFGYDQKAVAKALKKFIKKNKIPAKLVFIKPYKNGLTHSSNIKIDKNKTA